MAKIVTNRGDVQLSEGTPCAITFSRSDIRDLSKRTGDKSKTLTAVGNSENNKVLGYLFDVNITEATFDVNKKVIAQLIDDRGAMVMENAVMQLVSVDKSQTTIEHDDNITYSILLKSQEADLFTLIDNDELTELDFTEMNHTYNAANVVASFAHTKTEGYTYPQGVNVDSNFDLTDFRPAIYLKRYFDKIHGAHGFSYEVQGVDVFDKLIIPYNGDELVGAGDIVTFNASATKSAFTGGVGDITGWTELSDDESMFNHTTGVLTSPFYISTGQGFLVDVTFDFDLELTNPEASNIILTNSSPIGSLSEYYKPMIEIYKNGGAFPIAFGYIGNYEAVQGTVLAAGATTVLSLTGVVTIGASNLQPSDELTFKLKVNEITNAFLSWRLVSTGASVNVTSQVTMNSTQFDMSFTANAFGFSQLLKMNDFIPKKVKQKELIKSVTTMFNLMVISDKDNPNKIIYKTRDSYLDSGKSVDWSKKIAKDKTQLLQFIPELANKKLLLTYKEDSDAYNKAYIDNVNEVYGEVEFTFDSDFVRGVDKKEISFSPSPIIRNPNGAYVPAVIGQAPKNNLRILIHNGVLHCDPYNIYNFATTGSIGVDTYANCGHFDDPLNPTVDINFGVCDYYFYSGIILTNNNLFNDYWRRTIYQINKGKMLTADFDLNAFDIQNIDLSDKIYIENSWWNINRIIDFDANIDKLTKVELISVDDYLEFPAYKVVPPVKPPVRDPLPNRDRLIRELYIQKNLNLSIGSVDVKGKGNIIQSNLKGLVVGDGQHISDDGVFEDVPVVPTNEQNIIYKASITQIDGVAPIVEIISDSIGNVVWTRTEAGRYRGTSVGSFTGNIEVIITNAEYDKYAVARRPKDVTDYIEIDTGVDTVLKGEGYSYITVINHG